MSFSLCILNRCFLWNTLKYTFLYFVLFQRQCIYMRNFNYDSSNKWKHYSSTNLLFFVFLSFHIVWKTKKLCNRVVFLLLCHFSHFSLDIYWWKYVFISQFFWIESIIYLSIFCQFEVTIFTFPSINHIFLGQYRIQQ